MRILRRLRSWLFPSSAGDWPGCDITLAGGRELHLAGSVHMGTPDMTPLPAALLMKLASASALIVETDIVTDTSPFARVPPCTALHQRLDQALYQQVEQCALRLEIAPEVLNDKPAWLVALILQAHQAQRLGFRLEYGIDYQLLQAAHRQQKTVIELEGSQKQLALLQQLSGNGVALLQDALQHWHSNARLLQLMASWWSGSKPAQQAVSLPEVFSDELHQVLLRQRNQQWYEFLSRLPAGRYVVVAGALHLYGPDNLPQLLTAG